MSSLLAPAKNDFNQPGNLTGRQLVAKVAMGLVIGGIIAALLFVVVSFIGGMFTTALGEQSAEFASVNPLLPIILLFIGFISTFVGNISVAGVYSLFYSKKYYDVTKMFGLLFLTNGILFFILAPVYLVFWTQIDVLFVILGFHVLFSVFASAAQIEFTANPNYSGSAFMGNILWFAFALLMYGLFYKLSWGSAPQQKIYLFMLLPPILWYALIPFGSWIREKIYYKFYELGNNGFYIPSPGEGEEEEIQEVEHSEDVNVEN